MESHEATKEEKKTKSGDLGFPFSAFQNFKFPHLELPRLKKAEVGEVGGVASKAKESGGGDGDGKGPSFVRVAVPDGSWTEMEYPSLKWESEEAQGGNMWMVYALGGFMIVRWLWGRWKESRDNSAEPKSGSAAGDQPTNAES